MVGLGETDEEDPAGDARHARTRHRHAHHRPKCLAPSWPPPAGAPLHAPDTFRMFERSRGMGFSHAAVGAMVRSSYHADQQARLGVTPDAGVTPGSGGRDARRWVIRPRPRWLIRRVRRVGPRGTRAAALSPGFRVHFPHPLRAARAYAGFTASRLAARAATERPHSKGPFGARFFGDGASGGSGFLAELLPGLQRSAAYITDGPPPIDGHASVSSNSACVAPRRAQRLT